MNTTLTAPVRKAFTLLEMVAVLVLILVLAGIAVPTYRAVVGETRENAAVLSAKALRNYGDAYAATQQVAPSSFTGDFYDMACDELPGCGSDVGLWTLSNLTTMVFDDGTSREVCATILWSDQVGGQSQVAPCVGADEWEPATISGTLTYNSNAVAGMQATLLKYDWAINNFAPVCQNGAIDPTPSGFFYCTDPGQGGVVSTVTNSSGFYSLTVGANQLHGLYTVAGTAVPPVKMTPPFPQGFSNQTTVLSGESYTRNFNVNS